MIECICCRELEGITLKIATPGCESRQLIRHSAVVLVRQLFLPVFPHSLSISGELGAFFFFFLGDVSESFVGSQKFVFCELLTSVYFCWRLSVRMKSPM